MAKRGQELINDYVDRLNKAIAGGDFWMAHVGPARQGLTLTATETLVALVHWCDQRGVDWNDVTFRAGNAIRTHREEAKQDKAGT